jgi:hypothetical protein
MATGKYMRQSMVFDSVAEVEGCHTQSLQVYFYAKFFFDPPFQGDSEGLISFDQDDVGNVLDCKGEMGGEGYVSC